MFSFCLVIVILFPDMSRGKTPVIPALGAIHWERDFTKAKTRALMEKKPLFILFTRFDGEKTSEMYGQTVLNNPLLQEAIETFFIPMAVDNANPKEQRMLDFFNEPFGNLPVMRIYNPASNLDADRLAGVYSGEELAMFLLVGLSKYGTMPPKYLKILASEENCQPGKLNTGLNTSIALVPMTPKQREFVTKSLIKGKPPEPYLSPNQIFIYRKLKAEEEKKGIKELKKKYMRKSLHEMVAILKRHTGRAGIYDSLVGSFH